MIPANHTLQTLNIERKLDNESSKGVTSYINHIVTRSLIAALDPPRRDEAGGILFQWIVTE